MNAETLFLNYAGQDIEFRIAPDGKPETEWTRLPAESKLPVTLSTPCTVEFRLGERTVTESFEKPVTAVEVWQALQLRVD